ncbi:hypothetical protein HY484_03485 [Candidatus Woesearchaeota archaeon]|nr:hypothetical protein [Candidatus Woesearchaeota archaeon]
MITVFDRDEDTNEILAEYLEQNNKIRMLIGENGIQKEKEYRKKTGYDERLREQQKGMLYPPEPSMFALPREEEQKIWTDVGKGLELICAINLEKFDNEYVFSAGIVRPDIPEYDSDDDNGEYSTIKELVDGIKKHLAQLPVSYCGATIKPFFYTVTEEVSLDDALKVLIKKLGVPIPSDDIKMRGLNEQERTEFEQLL